MVASSNAEDCKLWPPTVEKKKPKGTCLLGNSKKGFGRLSEMSSINESEKPIAKTNFARNIKG